MHWRKAIVFPQLFSLRRISRLFKKNNDKDCKNFRPGVPYLWATAHKWTVRGLQPGHRNGRQAHASSLAEQQTFRRHLFNCLIINMFLVKCFNIFLSPKGGDLHFETGSKLMLVVYKGIAPGDERRSLPSLDISSKQLAEGLLHLAFAFGVRVRPWPWCHLSLFCLLCLCLFFGI